MNFEAIGTHWQIDIESKNKKKVDSIFVKIKKRIDDFDKTYSRFRSDSLIMQGAEKSGIIKLPKDSKELFSLYRKLYDLSGGTFSPMVGNLLEDAGYDKNYSLNEKQIKKPYGWDESIEFHDPELKIKKPVILDFGAGGKGYLIDIIASILEKNHFIDFTIDAGGDILYRSSKSKPIKIGLEHPVNAKQVIGVTEIKNLSICGSSGNRRKWGRFHHIVNPFTLTSPENIISTWVMAKSAFLADCLSTCLFLTPADVLKNNFSFEYLILKKDFSIIKSDGFPGKLFYDRQNS